MSPGRLAPGRVREHVRAVPAAGAPAHVGPHAHAHACERVCPPSLHPAPASVVPRNTLHVRRPPEPTPEAVSSPRRRLALRRLALRPPWSGARPAARGRMRLVHPAWSAAYAPPRPQRARYRRREPEGTVLHQVLRANLEPLLAHLRQRGGALPAFVQRELRAYLRCGVLAHGFRRLRCEGCRGARLVGSGCGGRTACPSCGGRRMADFAAHLVDRAAFGGTGNGTFPPDTFSVGRPLPLGPDPAMGPLPALEPPPARGLRPRAPARAAFGRTGNGTFPPDTFSVGGPLPLTRSLTCWQRPRASRPNLSALPTGRVPRPCQGAEDAQCGAVAQVQRFSADLSLNPHLHLVAPDGVFPILTTPNKKQL